MIPQTRAGRRQLILDILGRRSVRSQGELLEILSRDGFAVTQATLSRDLALLIKSGFRVERAHLIDLFPQTFHIESIFHLVR